MAAVEAYSTTLTGMQMIVSAERTLHEVKDCDSGCVARLSDLPCRKSWRDRTKNVLGFSKNRACSQTELLHLFVKLICGLSLLQIEGRWRQRVGTSPEEHL